MDTIGHITYIIISNNRGVKGGFQSLFVVVSWSFSGHSLALVGVLERLAPCYGLLPWADSF